MLKIAHKKTKRGSKCDECRRRHIRCDLTRPSCVNCSRSERFCSFQNAPEHPNGAPSSVGDSASPMSQTTPPFLPNGSSPTMTDIETVAGGDGTSGSLVNVAHIQLFHYFSTMPSPYPGMAGGITEMQRSMVIKFAFSTPYLMHELLAFSAKRQSIEFPHDSNSQYYRDQATVLQTRALGLFNARPELTQQNCIPVFLFSGMLGIHLLADTLSHRGGDLASFIDSFVSYITTHRSLRTLVAGLWPMLINTELSPILAWSGQATMAASQDTEVSASSRKLISEASNLSEEAAAACLEAVKNLEWALDETCVSELRHQRRVQMLFTWPLTIPEPYIELLNSRRPEALVILERYGALLCHCRDLWMVGDAGRYLTNLIRSSLDKKWMVYGDEREV